VHLRQDAGCYPRAYRRYPQIFVSQTPPGAIMFVPVGHKDDYFVPQDAGLLEGEARESACNRLFAGGWGGNAPLLSKREEGIPLPAGFASDEGLSQAFTAACDSRHEVAILARGESLARILRHEEALRDYNRKADAVIEAVARTANTGKIGDGKVFVLDLEQALRIRTGDRDAAAIAG
jgi:hypothetical protein